MRMNRGSIRKNVVLPVGLLVCLMLAGCISSGVNQAPILAIDVLPREGYAPLSVVFDVSRSMDPEGKALTVLWDFGDGSVASDRVTTHTYQDVGLYEVRVTLTDPEGLSSSATVDIDVQSIPSGYFPRRYEWERNGEARVWEVLIPYDLYQTYKGTLRQVLVDTHLYGDYVSDPRDDPTIRDYALALWSRAGQDEAEFIHETLSFVQGAIRYQADPPGVEHPLYPLETLADGHGDCEDTAILFVSLLQAMGIASKLAFVDTDNDLTPDHVLVFVAISPSMATDLHCDGTITTFTWDQQMYALAETAVDLGVYPLGCDPWNLDEEDLAELWSFPNL